MLGGVVIPVEAIYTHASRNINISAKVSGLFINFQSVATELVGLNLPGALRQPISSSIPTFIMSGKVTMEESELIVSATGGNIHANIIYKETGKSRKAIAFEMSNIEFASVLNDVVGLDIFGIPYFGTTVLPAIALTFAMDNTSGLPDDTFAHSPLLNTLGNIVNKDLTVLIDSKSAIKLRYSGNGFPTFSPATPGSINLHSLISAIPSFNLNSIPLPPGISGLLNLGIDEFIPDLSKKNSDNYC